MSGREANDASIELNVNFLPSYGTTGRATHSGIIASWQPGRQSSEFIIESKREMFSSDECEEI